MVPEAPPPDTPRSPTVDTPVIGKLDAPSPPTLDITAIGKVVREELDRNNKYLEFAQGQIEKGSEFLQAPFIHTPRLFWPS